MDLNQIKDIKLLGELHPANFTIKAFNLNGEITKIKTLNLWRDTESIISKESGLLSKRMEIPTGYAKDIDPDDILNIDNIDSNVDQGFKNNQALSNNELIMIDGEIRSDSGVYKDYRLTYNKNINGLDISNNTLTNVSWDSGYKWALFKMADQTVQIEGTGSFGVKFTTPYDKDFDDTSYQQGDGFKCYISLQSKTRNGIMFWYDINKSYEQETTGNVTGFGVFENKTRDNNNNIIFNIVIPVITDEFLIPDNIYIMLGLEKDTDINITDIELITTED